MDLIVASHSRRAGSCEVLARQGAPVASISIIVSGWTINSSTLPNGRRQVLGVGLPGDMCHPFMHLLPAMDHTVETITNAVIAEIPRRAFEHLINCHPRLARKFFIHALEQGRRQREWMTSLGQRTAGQRLAHFFHDVFVRMNGSSSNGGHCAFPLTQMAIGDAAGLSAVHVNRTIRDLRLTGLIEFRSHRLIVPDLIRLRAAAMLPPLKPPPCGEPSRLH